MRKHNKLVYQKSATPEPFARLTKLNAAQLKKPILSKTFDMIIVDRIVREAPLTIPNIFDTSLKGTIPARMINTALMAVGMDSLIPSGLQMRKKTIRKKTLSVYKTVKSYIYSVPHYLDMVFAEVPRSMSDKFGEAGGFKRK
jgi:hypothetical protein